jgi:hypothetical protein
MTDRRAKINYPYSNKCISHREFGREREVVFMDMPKLTFHLNGFKKLEKNLGIVDNDGKLHLFKCL